MKVMREHPGLHLLEGLEWHVLRQRVGLDQAPGVGREHVLEALALGKPAQLEHLPRHLLGRELGHVDLADQHIRLGQRPVRARVELRFRLAREVDRALQEGLASVRGTQLEGEGHAGRFRCAGRKRRARRRRGAGESEEGDGGESARHPRILTSGVARTVLVSHRCRLASAGQTRGRRAKPAASSRSSAAAAAAPRDSAGISMTGTLL